MNQQTQHAVGIDLGTTFSVVAHLDRDGRPVTLANDEGELTTPSVVFFDQSNTVVGREAVKAAEFEPNRAARFAKRDMGESFYHQPILGHHVPPEVIQALILRKLREDAELRIGTVKQVVVTVPAYFNEPRRKATQDAGRLADTKVLDIINEPTAAAIAYGVQQGFLSPEGQAHERERVMVYDLGGGTFDVTLMEIKGRLFKTLATAGDVHLGGIDWDRCIADLVSERFQEDHGIDPRRDAVAAQRLFDEAIRVKHALTARRQSSVRLAHEGQQLQFDLARSDFESRAAGLLDRTRMTVKRLLKEAGMDWSEVTRLLLVGGSTRMPMVQAMLEHESGLAVDRSLSPDEAVAHGAAIYAGMLVDGGKGVEQSFSVRNASSHDLGVLGVDPATKRPRRHVMIPRNSPLPCQHASLFKTAKQGQGSVAVKVVEGGTAAGEGATLIGKCVVQGLPDDLPAGTPVKVIFKYRADACLTVRAELPTASRDAQTLIQRAVGMTGDHLESWRKRLADGLVLEEEHLPDEPVDVDEIAGLLDDSDGELTLGELDTNLEDGLPSGENGSSTDAPPARTGGSGDQALDDFLKGIG